MEKYKSAKEMNEAMKSGKIKKGESIILDETKEKNKGYDPLILERTRVKINNEEKMEKKYNQANEDPLYWGMVIGLFLFGILTYWILPKLYFASLFSFIGIILYILAFKDQRLKKTTKERRG